jgi:putative transposase
MPRQARLDAPDVLQHVMVRGIERTLIFQNTTDRADFVARVAALAERDAWSVLAWAVLRNHARLLVRTGNWPLARSICSLLTCHSRKPITSVRLTIEQRQLVTRVVHRIRHRCQ